MNIEITGHASVLQGKIGTGIILGAGLLIGLLHFAAIIEQRMGKAIGHINLPLPTGQGILSKIEAAPLTDPLARAIDHVARGP